jgi:hypothetical protein
MSEACRRGQPHSRCRRIADRGLPVLFAVLVATGAATAEKPEPPRLHTNEAFIVEALQAGMLAIADPMAVFAFVLDSLPERVTVYPTENHYYFSFVHDSARFAGNIKIDARLRDEGRIRFAYYRDEAGRRGETLDVEVVLEPSRGVMVEKVEPLAYRVSYRGKSVVFALNDLSHVRPPPGALTADERFIGPVFDESAVRFFLVFNAKLKVFHYLLDETVTVADTLIPAKRNDRILIGQRTGFAFYRDHRVDRKVLIGAREDNVRANNYFDGPFDQIPDNFLDGDAFRQAILAVEPDLKGKIDRFGAMADGARYAVVPYLFYRSPGDLDVFHRCATGKRIPAAAYYQCFVMAPGETRGARARPLAMQRNAR